MDSLLVSYASSDEEDDDAACPRPSRPPKLPSFSKSVPPQASSSFLPSPPPLATSSSSSSPSSFLVSSLPPPKSQLPNHFLDDDNDSKDDEGKPSRPPLSSMFSFLPPAKTSMSYTLSSIPVADSQPGNQSSKLSSDQNPSKRIVRLTLPLNPSMLKSQDSDSDDNEDEKRRKARKNVSSSSSITSVLPAPKNSLCVAPAQSSGVSRRSTLQAITTSQSPSLDLKAVEEEVSIANGTNYSAEKGVASGYYDTSSYAAEQVASGYENYTNDLGNVVVDPGAMSNPAITCWEQVNGDGVGYGGYMDNCSIVSQGERRSVVPDIGRFTGKRGRANIPTEIVEVKQDELMKNRPREDQVKLTGIAFGPAYQPSPSAKGKPTKLHKRKHQIGSLYYDLKQKEMELSERRSKGLLTKAETQAKYGW